MKIDTTFLRSKVARRIFLQFILCALFPIGILAVFSVNEVTEQLTKESEARLLQATRAHGMGIYERLTLLEAELKLIASSLSVNPVASPLPSQSPLPRELNDRLLGLVEVQPSGASRTLFGTVSTSPELSSAESSWVRSGHTMISVASAQNHPHLYMVRMLDPQHPERGTLVAEVNPDYVWGTAALPAGTDACVLDVSYHPIYCSAGNLLLSSEQPVHPFYAFLPEVLGGRGNDSYVTRHWGIFLKAQFGAPQWTIVLGEPRSQALALLGNFENTFPRVILLSIWLVTLLSLVQIRRNLVPLERLQEATRRMSGFNFGTPVNVKSGDEFEDLAGSFNKMADRLSHQFQTLESINQIDRAILSSLDTRKIVGTVLTRFRQILPFDCVSISLADPIHPGQFAIYLKAEDESSEQVVDRACLTPSELSDLRRSPEVVFLNGRGDLPGYLTGMVTRGMKAFLLFPLIVQDRVMGVIGLGHGFSPAMSDEHIFQARQVADQVAVALSNALLIRQLADLHVGTLTALARAIDAKSGWTSGHSERVTALAVRIGHAMGLPQKELEIIHRGGLLHDIGKIGIPAHILDKPSKLSPEESQLMREHVRIGARILEPIPGLQEVIPIVVQHHEWFDGSGYPEGLAGGAISLNARIFALADCYDALTSERPYRPGLDHQRVIEIIHEETGSHFDPAVVQAFFRVSSERQPLAQTEEHSPVGLAPEGESL